MKKKISIAIVGCGRVAEHYYDIIKKIKKDFYKIESVCDIKESKARKFAKKFKCNFFTDYKKMLLSKKIDLIFVLTPSGNHYQIVKYALTKKINVLCEKPLTLLPEQTSELEKLANKKKKMLCVAFQNRLNPSVRFLKDCISKKKFGKIVKASVSLLWCRYQKYYNDGWHGTWKMDGGVINQQAIHYIDILRWLFGPVEEIFSYMDNRINKLQAEDTAVASLRFKNGVLGTIEATTAARPVDIHASLSLVGSKGTIVLGGLALNKITRIIGLKNPSQIIKKNSQNIKNGYGKSHLALIKKIIINLSNNVIKSPISANESYKTTQLIHAMYSSHERKKPIRIKDNIKSKKLGK